jgi:hypothetical protein
MVEPNSPEFILVQFSLDLAHHGCFTDPPGAIKVNDQRGFAALRHTCEAAVYHLRLSWSSVAGSSWRMPVSAMAILPVRQTRAFDISGMSRSELSLRSHVA